jgi:hypothetical protein
MPEVKKTGKNKRFKRRRFTFRGKDLGEIKALTP